MGSGRVAGLAALACVPAVAPLRALAACPGCVETTGAHAQAGFFWSALFLMLVPYFLLAAVGGGLFYAYRRAVRREVERLLSSVGSPPAVTSVDRHGGGGS